jgi:hypothetical protein
VDCHTQSSGSSVLSDVAAGAVARLGAHVWEREANEHYVEPEWCSKRLFEEEIFYGQVWDPCCGFGRIPLAAKAAGHDVYASDLVDRGYSGICDVGDFLTWNDPQCAPNIVCSPPFNIADKFALHALALAERKVALIFPTARLNAAHWLKGTPLLNVWLMTPRPSMPPGHVIARGEKPGGGKMDYCWLVFRKGYEGQPYLRWLRRDKEPE